MRVRTVLFALLAGSTFASAQPGADLPPPPEAEPVEAPPPVEAAPAPAEPPVVVAPAAPGVPPITINITNNNNGNNSNTNTQTNSQSNPQTNTQTATQENPQTNTQTNTVTTTIAPPSAIAVQPPVRAGVDRYELFRAKEKPARWITLGVTSELHGPPTGIRGSFDLISRGAFSLGVAGSISHDEEGKHGHDRHGRPTAGAVAYIAWTGKLGRFDLRAQIGVGAETTGKRGERDDDSDTIERTTGDDDDSPRGRHGHPRLGMRAEAAVLVGLPLGKRLGLVAGPVITAGKPDEGEKKAVDAQLVAGLRWRF